MQSAHRDVEALADQQQPHGGGEAAAEAVLPVPQVAEQRAQDLPVWHRLACTCIPAGLWSGLFSHCQHLAPTVRHLPPSRRVWRVAGQQVERQWCSE